MVPNHIDGSTRRNAIKAIGGAGAFVLAGCTGDAGNGGNVAEILTLAEIAESRST